MAEAFETVTIPLLQQRKRDGKKSIGVVAWDYPTTRFADRAGVDFIVIGDSVGANLWGHATPLEVTLDEILVCCKAVRRATERMVVSCDMPYGPVQEGLSSAMKAAVRIIKEGGADMIKVDAAANHPDVVRAMAQAGIPVFAQFGLTPQTALKYGIPYSAQNSAAALASKEAAARLVEEALMLEECGAVALDFTNSGPVAGEAVVKAVKIPCIGGFGGGPWLDGRVRLAQTVLGYGEKWIDSKTDTYFNTAQGTIDAFKALVADARAGKQIKG
ncbi:MAG: 3-methyl-2-oxobutanoate hydroxymethyltransferase [Beijerinckiaceae bacterium]